MLKRLREPVHPRAWPYFQTAYCLALIAVTVNELLMMGDRYAQFSAFYGPIPPFAKLGLGLPNATLVIGAGIGLCIALAIAATGRLEKSALGVALVCYLLFYGTVLGWAMAHPESDRPSDHHTLHFYVLLILLLAPREPAAWPLLAVRAALAVAYLGAAYSKLDEAGLRWLDGYNLQTIFVEKYAMRPDLELGYRLAQSHTLCVALSWATVAFEVGFATVLLWPRRHPIRWLYVAAGLGFHVGTWLLMGIWQFILSFCAAYLVFFEWPLKPGALMPPGGEAPRGGRPWAALALIAVMCVGAFGRVHFWPLAGFETYATYQDYRDQVDVTHCEHVQPDGTGKPCFGTSKAIGAQVVVRLQRGENVQGGLRRWLDEQMAKVPPLQRRMLIGRTVRLTARWFPVVDGQITVKKQEFTLAQ